MIACMMSVVEALVQVYARRHVRKVIINISKTIVVFGLKGLMHQIKCFSNYHNFYLRTL